MSEDKIEISRRELKLLCLNVDYFLDPVEDQKVKDEIEGISIKLQKKHGFNSYKTRLEEQGLEEVEIKNLFEANEMEWVDG